MNDYGYNDGQMIFGDIGGLKLPDICLIGEEKPQKNLTQEACPDRDRTRARCVTGTHATARPTAVDSRGQPRYRWEEQVKKTVAKRGIEGLEMVEEETWNDRDNRDNRGTQD